MDVDDNTLDSFGILDSENEIDDMFDELLDSRHKRTGREEHNNNNGSNSSSSKKHKRDHSRSQSPKRTLIGKKNVNINEILSINEPKPDFEYEHLLPICKGYDADGFIKSNTCYVLINQDDMFVKIIIPIYYVCALHFFKHFERENGKFIVRLTGLTSNHSIKYRDEIFNLNENYPKLLLEHFLEWAKKYEQYHSDKITNRNEKREIQYSKFANSEDQEKNYETNTILNKTQALTDSYTIMEPLCKYDTGNSKKKIQLNTPSQNKESLNELQEIDDILSELNSDIGSVNINKNTSNIQKQQQQQQSQTSILKKPIPIIIPIIPKKDKRNICLTCDRNQATKRTDTCKCNITCIPCSFSNPTDGNPILCPKCKSGTYNHLID
jgi:hypothetical protein